MIWVGAFDNVGVPLKYETLSTGVMKFGKSTEDPAESLKRREVGNTRNIKSSPTPPPKSYRITVYDLKRGGG